MTDNGTICEIDPFDMSVMAYYLHGQYLKVITEYKNSIVLSDNKRLVLINRKGERQQIIDHARTPIFQAGNHIYTVSDNLTELIDIAL